MPLIDYIDGPNRRIYLGVDSVTTDIVPMDIYTEMRALRRQDEALRKFDVFLSGEGKVAKGGGAFTERYVKELLGTRIVPYDTSHTLKVISGIITDDGQQGIACFDRSPLSPATLVDIDYQPPQVEVLEVVTGGGIGTPGEVADAVWNAILTGETYNIQNSAGKRLRDIASQAIHTDNAQGPAANGNQIQLAVSASDVDGSYDPSMITIIDGTGAGQTRLIYQYEGSSRIATVDRTWKVNPDATSEYIIFSNAGREHVNEGLAQGGTLGTITLNALASSVDDAYVHQTIFLRSGKGEDQVKHVTAYDGTTKVASIHSDWSTIPDGTTGYAMLPILHHELLASELTAISNSVWDALIASHTTVGSFGVLLADVLKLTGHKVTKSGDIITIYEADGIAVWRQYDLANEGRVQI